MDARIPLIVPQLHLGPHIDLLLDLLIDLLLLLLVLLLVVLNRAVELRRTRIGHRRNVSFVVFTTDNSYASVHRAAASLFRRPPSSPLGLF